VIDLKLGSWEHPIANIQYSEFLTLEQMQKPVSLTYCTDIMINHKTSPDLNPICKKWSKSLNAFLKIVRRKEVPLDRTPWW